MATTLTYRVSRVNRHSRLAKIRVDFSRLIKDIRKDKVLPNAYIRTLLRRHRDGK